MKVKKTKKVLLHTHLEGSLPAEMLKLLSIRNKVLLPFDPITDNLSNFCQKGNWQTFRRVFFAICSCFKTADDFTEAVVAYAQQLQNHGVLYAEVHCTPWKHLSRGVALDEISTGLLLGVKLAEELHNVRVRIITDLTRNPHEDAQRIVDWLLSLPRSVFVALGVSGGDGALPRNNFARHAERAKSRGIFITVHAGELEGPESVRDALDFLFADRIGHGIRAIEDPSLIQRLVESNVHLEVCPTANRIIGVGVEDSSHIASMMASGLSFSINTDDELIFGTNLSQEFEYLLAAGIIKPQHISPIIRNSVYALFAGDEIRNGLMQEILGTDDACPAMAKR